MKKRFVIQLWQTISLLTLLMICFQIRDEAITRREYLIIIIITITGFLAGTFLIRKSKPSVIPVVLSISALISFVICLHIEENDPIVLILPEETTFEVTASPENPADLTWAYWSQPDRERNNEFSEWHTTGEISRAMLSFRGDWNEKEKKMQCSGKCSFSLKKSFHLSRPVICFESNETNEIRKGESLFKTQAGLPLFIFGTSSGLSAQLVFAILCLSICGALSLPLFCIALIFQKFNFRKGALKQLSWILIYPASFLIPIILVIAICRANHMYPFGEKTFLISDMQCQYVDYLIYFKGILSGDKSIFYSFSKSIGDDFLSLYAYYLGNPLNWITALFPIEKMPFAINLIIIFRYGLCGLTSSVYFRNVFRTKTETLFFSTAYSLIALQFVIIEHIQLRDGAILLPLVLLGIEQFIRNNNKALYIITLCASFLISYYSAYQICFYCVLYILFRLLLTNRFSWKRFGAFILWSFTSAALCGLFLIPVAIQLTKGMKSFDLTQFTFSLNMHFSELAGKLFNSAFDLDQTLTSGLPSIYCGLFTVVGLPLFFLNKDISRKEKTLTAIMLLLLTSAMMVRTINIILHGFNEPVWWPYRYSFIVCFFMISVSLRCFQNRKGISDFSMGISTMMTFALLAWTARHHFSWFSQDAVYLNTILILFVIFLWFFSRSEGKQVFSIILIISSLDLFLNGWSILEEKTALQRTESESTFRSFFTETKPIIQALKTEDDGFYRTEKTFFRDANDSMTLDYQGIGHYSSTLNYSVMQFLPKMGYRYYPWRFLYGEGSDLTADSLLGIRYIISDDKMMNKPYPEVLSVNNKEAYQNPYSLPIAFYGKNNSITDQDIITFKLQNEIFRKLTGNTEPIYTEPEIYNMVFENLGPSSDKSNCFESIDKTQDASLQLKFLKQGRQAHYLYIMNDSDEIHPAEIYVNDSFLTDYFDGNGIPVIYIPINENEDIQTITLRPQEDLICFDEIQIAAEDTTILEKYAKTIQKSSKQIQKKSENFITGEIEANDKGYLILTIPYDKGWRIRIDGKKAVTEKAFDVFLSTPITEGKHTFEMKYLPEGTEIGCTVTGAAIMFLTFDEFRRRQTKKVVDSYEKEHL